LVFLYGGFSDATHGAEEERTPFLRERGRKILKTKEIKNGIF